MAGIVAAQEADVFVGVHGANTANSWLMRPGSSLVELTMYEFDEDCSEKNCPHTNVPLANSQVHTVYGQGTDGCRPSRPAAAPRCLSQVHVRVDGQALPCPNLTALRCLCTA